MAIELKKPLPELTSTLIRKYTNQIDIITAAESKGISYEVLKRVVYRTANVTEKNVKGVDVLILIAQVNCEKTIVQAQNDLPLIESLTQTK